MTKPNFSNDSNIQNEDDLKWKMTSNGRLPKTNSNSNFKLRLI